MIISKTYFFRRLIWLAYILLSIWLFCEAKRHLSSDGLQAIFGKSSAEDLKQITVMRAEGNGPESKVDAEVPEVPEVMEAQIGIVMFGCNRTKYMARSLRRLLDIRTETRDRFVKEYGVSERFLERNLKLPIIVSMDCHYKPTLEFLKFFPTNSDGISKVYDFSEIDSYVSANFRPVAKHLKAYYRLSRNYYLAFKNVFADFPSLQQLIVVEDDLDYSSDFLEYFIALSPLLRDSREIFCIAAWNDNGKSFLLNSTLDSNILRHTEFFPGLGWMFNRAVWEDELESSWPAAFWDDWLRGRLNGRTCVQPMVSRSETFGRKGASNGQFFDSHLQKIKVAEQYIPFFEQVNDLNRNLSLDRFDRTHLDTVYAQSKPMDAFKFYQDSSRNRLDPSTAYRIVYYTNYQFRQYTTRFELMSDLKVGVPRSAYKGIISFRFRGYRAFLAPPPTRKIYIRSWN